MIQSTMPAGADPARSRLPPEWARSTTPAAARAPASPTTHNAAAGGGGARGGLLTRRRRHHPRRRGEGRALTRQGRRHGGPRCSDRRRLHDGPPLVDQARFRRCSPRGQAGTHQNRLAVQGTTAFRLPSGGVGDVAREAAGGGHDEDPNRPGGSALTKSATPRSAGAARCAGHGEGLSPDALSPASPPLAGFVALSSHPELVHAPRRHVRGRWAAGRRRHRGRRDGRAGGPAAPSRSRAPVARLLGLVRRGQVAIPLGVHLVTVAGNAAIGGPAPWSASLTPWYTLVMVFALRLVNPLDGPLGEEPAWRGYCSRVCRPTDRPWSRRHSLPGRHRVAPAAVLPAGVRTAAVRRRLHDRLHGGLRLAVQRLRGQRALITLIAHATEGSAQPASRGRRRPTRPAPRRCTRRPGRRRGVLLLVADRRALDERAASPPPGRSFRVTVTCRCRSPPGFADERLESRRTCPGRRAGCATSSPGSWSARGASEPLAVAGEVVPAHPALHRLGLPLDGLRRRDRGRVLRHPDHRSLPTGPLRLQPRGAAMVVAGRLLRLRRSGRPIGTRRSRWPSVPTTRPPSTSPIRAALPGLALVKWWLLALPHYLVLAFLVGGATWTVNAPPAQTSRG